MAKIMIPKMTRRSLTAEMDRSVQRMLKLIEEDGDSFAKKAEMYYQKRPELVSSVEDFYRIYRTLAEKYDHLIGELRKNIPSDLQSQGSAMSDVGSEPPSPDLRISRRKSGPRAAGFEFFLGSGGNSSDMYQKEGNESYSSSESEPESDDSPVSNYSGLIGNGADQGMRRKMIDLEIELREVREKLREQQLENVDASGRGSQNDNSEDFVNRIAGYEDELRIANEKLRLSSEEISKLKLELQNHGVPVKPESMRNDVTKQDNELEAKPSDTDCKIHALEEELKITKEMPLGFEKGRNSLSCELDSNTSEEKLRRLQDQLELTEKDLAMSKSMLSAEKKEVAMSKSMLSAEKKEVTKLNERAARLKASLTDRESEIRDLKMELSEISGLFTAQSITKEQIKEFESRTLSLEEENRKVKAEKTEMEEKFQGEIEKLRGDIVEISEPIKSLNQRINVLNSEKDELITKAARLEAENVVLSAGKEDACRMVDKLLSRVKELEEEVDRHRTMMMNGAEEKREAIKQLCFSLEYYRDEYQRIRKAFVAHKKVRI